MRSHILRLGKPPGLERNRQISILKAKSERGSKNMRLYMHLGSAIPFTTSGGGGGGGGQGPVTILGGLAKPPGSGRGPVMILGMGGSCPAGGGGGDGGDGGGDGD